MAHSALAGSPKTVGAIFCTNKGANYSTEQEVQRKALASLWLERAV